jgi:hypothetical protein
LAANLNVHPIVKSDAVLGRGNFVSPFLTQC